MRVTSPVGWRPSLAAVRGSARPWPTSTRAPECTVALLDIDEPRATRCRRRARGARCRGGRVPRRYGRHRVDSRSPRPRVDERFGGCDLLCANVGVQQFGSIDALTRRRLDVGPHGERARHRPYRRRVPAAPAATRRLAPDRVSPRRRASSCRPCGSARTPRASARSWAMARRCGSSSPTRASA